MKKTILIFISAVLIFVFSSCSGKNTDSEKGVKTDNAAATTEKSKTKTFTGSEPLERISFNLKDVKQEGKFSTAKIEHSYGVAKNGKPHSISVESQQFFETKKFNAITFDTQTNDKIYLTFDCGYENGYTSKILDILNERNVKAAFFCTLDQIKSEPELIARMINEGHIVGNHSTTHPSFDTLNYDQIAKELEECENYLRENFGYSSEYFRFPKGNYSETALDAVGRLGYLSVFWSLSYADWNTEKRNGADYAFDKVTQRLHPGAIILLHSVSADNAEALESIIEHATDKGYVFSSLNELEVSYSNYSTGF